MVRLVGDPIRSRRVTLGRVVALHLSASNDIRVVEQVVQETARFLGQQARPSEAWMLRFCLCLRETVYNAVMHGNRGSRDAAIEIDVEHHGDAGRVVIVVRDGGRGFDWKTALESQRGQDPERQQGRGLIILAEMADSVEVQEGEVRFALALPRDREPGDGAPLAAAGAGAGQEREASR